LPLASPLAPDKAVTIALTFRVVIPDDSNGTFGIFTHNTGRDLWTLADWYPIVAGWDADLGWRVDAPTPAGDPTYADAGIYSVTITYPSALKMVATGTAIDSEPRGDLVTETIETGPVRDFTMIAGADLESVDSNVGGTDIHVWSTTAPAAQEAAAWVSDLASRMLAAYNEQFGQYPYDELDIVSTPIRQSVLGVSWSGLVMLSDKLFLNDLSWINQNPNTAAFAITHELGHQWWGNMIGANSNDHSFMVEGLTNALTMGAIDTVLGAETADALLSEQITGPYRNALESVGDGVVDTQIGRENPNGPSRIALTYGKGALGFLALRVAMGDAAFYAAIDEYAQDYLYLNATPDELHALFIKHAPNGVNVQTIWRTWFYRSATESDDVDALANQIDDRFYADSGATG
ncbi:MAG: M1 family aminopeptidase, partial [Thermomicrobiales bacterium]